jgi:hypothetical protein
MQLVTNYTKDHSVINKGDKVFLQSYKSIVAMYDVRNDTIYLGHDWNYSRTTLKYVKKFMAMIMECDTTVFKKKDLEKIEAENECHYKYGTQVRVSGPTVDDEFYERDKGWK